MAVPVTYYLLLGAVLFAIGIGGVLSRRNIWVALMALQVALVGVHLSWAAFARYHGQLDGQIFALFSLVVNVAQIGVGMALVLAFFRSRKSVDSGVAERLKW